MCVQYQIPKGRRVSAYPVVMVYGSSHTAKTYEDTPDGRMGWAEYFVRRGVPTYVVDHAGRGRSGFDPSPTNQARLEKNAATVPGFTIFTNENAWTNFRFGPAAFTPYPTTKFPILARDQYFAQLVPNTETSYAEGGRATIAALAALLDPSGPPWSSSTRRRRLRPRRRRRAARADTNNQQLADLILSISCSAAPSGTPTR